MSKQLLHPALARSFTRALLLCAFATACADSAPEDEVSDGDEPRADEDEGDENEDAVGADSAGAEAAPKPVARADAGPHHATRDASLDAATRPRDAAIPMVAPSDGAVGDRPDRALPSTPSLAERTIVPHPSWSCGMEQGIPAPEGAPHVFTAEFDIAQIREVGVTQFGKRQLIELATGTVKGPKLEATLEKGGLDQPLVLANGVVELEEILMLKTSDGRFIYLRVCGVAPSEDDRVRVVMDFEAPNNSPYAFLNTARLVGTRELDVASKKITLSVHDLSDVSPSTANIVLENPKGVVDQTWECKVGQGAAGEELFREVVGIGSSQSVGASKRGNRNAIPITGGTVSGDVEGQVLPGGADFQLVGSGFHLDARYTLLTDDDELILVRNCGPATALLPVLEARAEGPYGYLNERELVSSSPVLGLGTVTLVISEKR